MAQDHPDVVKMGLRLKKIGNEVVTLVGGREIHPINVRVGGFYRVPTQAELAPLAEELKWAREAALKTVRWVGTLPMPEFEQDYEFVSLRHATEYPFNEGRLVSNQGLDIPVQEYEAHFAEEHVPYSNALHSELKDHGPYFAGPLARYNLNFDRLSPLAREAATEAGLGPECRNPFQSIIVRAVETLYAVDEALRSSRPTNGRINRPSKRSPEPGWARRHRGAPGPALSPLSPGRIRRHPGRQDRAPHLPKPEDHRAGPGAVRGQSSGSA